jgi:predicted sugar kinase
LVEAFLEWGAAGVGQSSWGPAVYGLVDSEAQGQQLVALAEKLLQGQGRVALVGFDNQGVRVKIG